MITDMQIRLLEEIANGRLHVKELLQAGRPESWRIQLAVALHGMGGVPKNKESAEIQESTSSSNEL